MSLRINSFILSSAERYCLVIDNSTKLPIYYPNLFITTQIRNSSKSVSTMISAAASLIVLLNFINERNINLEERILTKKFFSLSEFDDLRDFTQKRHVSENISKVVSISKKKDTFITSQSHYNRLTVIYKYIEWLSLEITENQDKLFINNLNRCLRSIKAQRPAKKGRNNLIKSKALSKEDVDFLFEVIRLNSEFNPFKRETQRRNRLIILMLYMLGIRGGELLNIKIQDINFSSNQVSIIRRADEKSDLRVIQPLVKTNERIIPINDNLAKELYNYIQNERRKVAKNKKHDYLFVVHRRGLNEGNPLPITSYHRVIKTIKKAAPSLKTLTGHSLRHTWNLEFSKKLDSMDNPLSEERQEKIRSYLMGWKEDSGTAKIYNRRFINEKANEVALQLQNSINKE
ncbi:site-specific integrase [Salmonella enterica]|nr:site-specific integrase [Salmonella enterica]